MKMAWVILVSLMFSEVALAEERDAVEAFSIKLVEYISNNEIDEVYRLDCYPENNDCINDHAIEYIFNKNHGEGLIYSLMSDHDLKINIYGPSTYDSKHPNSTYVIAFYLPGRVSFGKGGYANVSDIEREWGKGYIETIVTVIKGKVHLHRTIFYHGAHAPWADDYG